MPHISPIIWTTLYLTMFVMISKHAIKLNYFTYQL